MGKLSAKCCICNSHMDSANDEYADKFKDTIGLTFNLFNCETCNLLQAIPAPNNEIPEDVFDISEEIIESFDVHIQWYKSREANHNN